MSLHLVAIVGSTATGKTRLGVDLAHHLGSEIVSADSRQVYRGLDLGTGKDLDEYSRVSPAVPHHLIDVVDPTEVYTLFRYQRDCFRLLRRLADEGRLGSARRPLLMVGGSGLYAEAVLRQFRLPDVPEDRELRRRLMGESHETLVAELRSSSPALAERTDLASTKRVVRALEIATHARSQPLSWSEPLGIDLRFMVFALRLSREELARRIALRVDQRLEAGMVDEVGELLERGLPGGRLEMLGMEYREVGAYLAGRKSYGVMVGDLKREIRHLAKRQETWFRGMQRRGLPLTWIQPGNASVVLEDIRTGRWSRSEPPSPPLSPAVGSASD